MPTDLEQSIYRTVCWFSLSEYPLTFFELWKWLYAPKGAYSLEEVHWILEESAWLKDRLQISGGFIARRADDIDAQKKTRHERFLLSLQKLAALRRVAPFFGLLPGIEAVTACNTLGWFYARAKSDIDLFIITRPETIWTSRLLLVTPFALLKKRDDYCFSFFTTTNALALERFTLPGEDPYFAYWTKALIPIFDRSDQLKTFRQVNRWADEVLPNAMHRGSDHRLSARPFPRLFAFPLERFARRIQEKKFPERIRGIMNMDTRVVVTDDMLKFHVGDRREAFRQAWQERYES